MKPIQKELSRFWQVISNPAMIALLIIGNVMLFLSTVVFYFLEKNHNPMLEHYFDALWWGVTTITTVGYGDIVPVTVPGQIVGLLLMYSGTIMFIAFTGFIVGLWLRAEMKREIYPIEKQMGAMKREMQPIEQEVAQEEREQQRIEKLLNEIKERLDRLEKK